MDRPVAGGRRRRPPPRRGRPRRLREREARSALWEAAANDPFWAVRQAALEGLDPANPADFDTLSTAAAEDPKSTVRAAALDLLGVTGNAPFLIERFHADSSYAAQAAALRSLGRAGGDLAPPVLEEAAAMASPRDVIARAAREALESLR